MKYFLILLFIPKIIFAKECAEYNVRIIFDRKPVITKEILCSKKTPDHLLFYVSKSCERDMCEILKRKKVAIKVPDYFGNMGSPGFKLCSELGGVPQIFEFQKDASSSSSSLWQSADRCFFEKDFVEISLLTREWKQFINK